MIQMRPFHNHAVKMLLVVLLKKKKNALVYLGISRRESCFSAAKAGKMRQIIHALKIALEHDLSKILILSDAK